MSWSPKVFLTCFSLPYRLTTYCRFSWWGYRGSDRTFFISSCISRFGSATMFTFPLFGSPKIKKGEFVYNELIVLMFWRFSQKCRWFSCYNLENCVWKWRVMMDLSTPPVFLCTNELLIFTKFHANWIVHMLLGLLFEEGKIFRNKVHLQLDNCKL